MARTKDAVTAIKPAIGPPRESVENLVSIGGIIPAIEENLRIGSGFWVVPVVDADEKKIRSSANPNAAHADLEAADKIDILHEHGALVGAMIAVSVLEDQDPVCAAEDVFELFGIGL